MNLEYLKEPLVSWRGLKVGDKVKVHLVRSRVEYHREMKRLVDSGTIFTVHLIDGSGIPVCLHPGSWWLHHIELYEVIERNETRIP